jgi:preprotein translocase subunit SecG
MRRLLRTLAVSVFTLLLLAPAAMAAEGFDAGEGTYGETNDKVVTNAGFILTAFFPLLVFVLSMIQWKLDKRKDARKAAEKARRARADLRGGW